MIRERTAPQGLERGPSPQHRETTLNRQDRHALLVNVLTNVIPWVTPMAAIGFLIAWLVSIANGLSDDVALGLFIVLTVFSGYAWACRCALLGPDKDADPKP